MNLLSNCCGSGITDQDKNGHGKCADCKENTAPNTLCVKCETNDLTLEEYVKRHGFCEDCKLTIF